MSSAVMLIIYAMNDNSTDMVVVRKSP